LTLSRAAAHARGGCSGAPQPPTSREVRDRKLAPYVRCTQAVPRRVGALVDLVHDRPGFVVEVGPSAALEYAALVLLRPAGPLHHSVNGDLRGGRQLHVAVPSR